MKKTPNTGRGGKEAKKQSYGFIKKTFEELKSGAY
jgi:hypothetical protein